ncbi:ethylene-responsive transcription factor erf109 [Phtheirospermum japonicum]|uniref:Ethylene-responsive transcription factor erf109 n=1 Tax=Phtheirospermum japonicum TaxID=374723 RepID=A0A830BKH8_9LAMI|nr:ethylene-responsive transcription factor erf109 [Phtheirospermum japonicum]
MGGGDKGPTQGGACVAGDFRERGGRGAGLRQGRDRVSRPEGEAQFSVWRLHRRQRPCGRHHFGGEFVFSAAGKFE